uniref:Reverse transcriptase RNase H-like domain-containing protein n=1 Tax=Amphimedon queenslandica TaxID=400682 RepID=A0A1X7VJH3_AMPQE
MKNLDFNQTFILQIDASGVGVGAILSQGEENLDEGPDVYFSKKLLPREQAYSTVKKKCLAIILAIKHFSAYFIGRSFIIQTDHRAFNGYTSLKRRMQD